jgi:hypothetical protein
MNQPYCFECIYFVPEGERHNKLEDQQWDESLAGDCRHHCPVACEPAEDLRRINYAYWPIVMASDWCGEHEPRNGPEMRLRASRLRAFLRS